MHKQLAKVLSRRSPVFIIVVVIKQINNNNNIVVVCRGSSVCPGVLFGRRKCNNQITMSRRWRRIIMIKIIIEKKISQLDQTDFSYCRARAWETAYLRSPVGKRDSMSSATILLLFPTRLLSIKRFSMWQQWQHVLNNDSEWRHSRRDVSRFSFNNGETIGEFRQFVLRMLSKRPCNVVVCIVIVAIIHGGQIYVRKNCEIYTKTMNNIVLNIFCMF